VRCCLSLDRIRGDNDHLRVLPISTRLAAVLEMAKTDPAGRAYGPGAYVFGLLGEQVKSIDKAQETYVLRAYWHEPMWATNGKLDAGSREQLRTIDLHFHDLRHETGSRFVEAGMPLHHVKEVLGHANISQTDTYLNAGRVALRESMQRIDTARGGKLVANEPPTEHRPVSQEEGGEAPKDLLH
jgi:integrase